MYNMYVCVYEHVRCAGMSVAVCALVCVRLSDCVCVCVYIWVYVCLACILVLA